MEVANTFVALDASQSYIFQITDANNCTYTEGYSPAITSTIRARVKSGGDTQICTGATDGSGTFLIDGFANNYTYNINAGGESAPQNNGEVAISSLGSGTYTIAITDVDTGCTDTVSFTVQEPVIALSLTGTVTAMTCANGNLGRVVANPTGGWGITDILWFFLVELLRLVRKQVLFLVTFQLREHIRLRLLMQKDAQIHLLSI